MTTQSNEVVDALRKLITGNAEGLAVQDMQMLLWEKFRLKLSYKEIEQTLIHNSDLFNERDWKWIIREV